MTFFKQALFLCSISFWLASCGGSDDTPRLARDTRASDPKAQALFNEGMAAEKSGDLKKARKRYRAVTLKYPLFTASHEAAFRRGKLLEKKGDPLEAFEAYNDVLTKYPASPHYAAAMKRQELIAQQSANGNITQSFIGINTRVSTKDTAKMLTRVRENAPRSPSGEWAQFTLGRLHQKEGSGDISTGRAIAAYRELTRDYPNSKYAPEAQYQIGRILLSAAKTGNQDSANLDRAKRVFDDLLIAYPDSKQARLAKAEIATLASGEVQRNFDIAEFYRKKENIPSALFYYQETIRRSKQGPLAAQARSWIQKLSKP